ncbi:MAG: TIGR04086 family membrane protein [Clostridia bacterium]|nr:TIGR04086 family membrane protein [Clostridia bacterium]
MTQAVRKFRRGGGKSTAFWRGLMISVLATAAAVIVFALIISFVDMSDGIIRIVNQLIKAAAVFLGVKAIVPRGDENGIRRGALLGLVYMGVGVLVYALLTQQKISWQGYLIDVFMGVAAGGLSGMLLGSLHRKQ